MQIKIKDNPFISSQKLVLGENSFREEVLLDKSFRLFLDLELYDLVRPGTLDVESIGMYRNLIVIYPNI
jgi:hypothetical protein